jgi:hypothetical protein
MDIAVNFVEHCLRLNGYLTLSEFEIQQRDRDGQWQTVTDIDMVALRFPVELFAGDPHEGDDCRLLLIEDDALHLEPDSIGILIGEVKQGDAVLNAGMKSHATLHTILRRFEWLFAEPPPGTFERLQARGVSIDPSREVGRVRTRLVAFGRSPTVDLNTVSLTHVFASVYGYFRTNDPVLRGAPFKEPAPALLHLLVKTGFDVTKPES